MITQFGIHLKVKNINKSLVFYKAFGLEPVFAYGDKKFLKLFQKNIQTAPEKYRGVVFKIGETLFEIADGHMAVKNEVFQEKIISSKISAMLNVKSVQKIIEICKQHSFSIAAPPRIFPWGTKEVVVKDLDGFILVFIEKLIK